MPGDAQGRAVFVNQLRLKVCLENHGVGGSTSSPRADYGAHPAGYGVHPVGYGAQPTGRGPYTVRPELAEGCSGITGAILIRLVGIIYA